MKTIKIILFTVLVCGCLLFSLLDSHSYNMKSINEFLEAQVVKDQTPSIQYVFFDTDSILFEKRFGYSNLNSRIQVSARSNYHLYSITKTFTALSVLQLVEAGKIELNKQVNFYLPDFPYPPEITVEQLLNHTSGIPNPLPLRWIHLEKEHSGFDRNQFFTEIFKNHIHLDFKPGTDV